MMGYLSGSNVVQQFPSPDRPDHPAPAKHTVRRRHAVLETCTRSKDFIGRNPLEGQNLQCPHDEGRLLLGEQYSAFSFFPKLCLILKNRFLA